MSSSAVIQNILDNNNNFVPTLNIIPVANPDGTYTFTVTGYELVQIMKAIKYQETHRASARKWVNKNRVVPIPVVPRSLTLNVVKPDIPR